MLSFFFFFFNDTATTEIYTLSLHDALPISSPCTAASCTPCTSSGSCPGAPIKRAPQSSATCSASITRTARSEEHTSELQSRLHLVCRLLLEKKKINTTNKKEHNINIE